ncbi:hypothetical protein J116_011365 [Streptomyces thermolilacinus SPC6]|uniref:Uncharacterized protein n=1 Tax=Streptomyces thermolilacinus SPC6 TaxID=1306406 RepID=A0A1D3DRP1_9ACTN|nr:hypothetical protein J116_011365 [Streptomyces thermolilacinus SPC6]
MKRNVEAVPTARWRFLRCSLRNSGSAARDSTPTSAATASAASPRHTHVVCEDHPSSVANVNPMTVSAAAAVASTPPLTSRRPAGASGRSRGTLRHARAMTSATRGTLTKKTARHPSAWVSTPPRIDPRTMPADPAAPQMPNALFLAGPSSKLALSSARIAGESAAPPTPWTARPITSGVGEVAAPPRTDPRAKSATPAMNRRRLPYRSTRRPQRSRSPPKAIA